MLNIYIKLLSHLLDPLPVTILEILSGFVFNKKCENIDIKYNKFSPPLFFKFDQMTARLRGTHLNVLVAMLLLLCTLSQLLMYVRECRMNDNEGICPCIKPNDNVFHQGPFMN